MIDGTYFRTRLAADVGAFEQAPIVEVHLLNGQFHRLRHVLEVQEGYIILEAYRLRSDETMGKPDSGEEVFGQTSNHEVERSIVSYESIAQVLIMPSRRGGAPRIGFGPRRMG